MSGPETGSRDDRRIAAAALVEVEGYVRSSEEKRIFAVVEEWNARGGADMDTDGAIEAELESYGFQTRTPSGKPRRNLLWHDPEEWTAFFRRNAESWGGRR